MGAVRILRVVENGEPDDLIDAKEAAAILNIRVGSVYRATKDGRLTRYLRLFDGQVMVRRSEVERLAKYRPERPASDERRRDEAV